MPYGKCYCATLDEWRFLLRTLAQLQPDDAEDDSDADPDDAAILESVLDHVCSTLGPQDLLHVLPDDGDLALYIATIERSARQADARRAQPQGKDEAAQAQAEEEDLFFRPP